MRSFFASVAVALSLAAAGSAGAATLTIGAGNTLLGATDVKVGNNLYNVTFADSTCADLFGTCAQSAFDFTTAADALAAAQALLDQVFTGTHDTNPQMTFGCGNSAACIAFVPYAVEVNSMGTRLISAIARNFAGTLDDKTQGNIGRDIAFDFGSKTNDPDNKFVLARFSPMPAVEDQQLSASAFAAVPAPAAGILLLGALGSLAALRRRRRAA